MAAVSYVCFSELLYSVLFIYFLVQTEDVFLVHMLTAQKS